MKTLVAGDRGANVTAAQKRLAGGNVFGENYFRAPFERGLMDGPTTRACQIAKYWLGYSEKDQTWIYGDLLDAYLSGRKKLPIANQVRRAARKRAAKPRYITYRELALQYALKEAARGVHEIGTSNRGERVDQYQDADGLAGRGYPWCMSFVQWCFKQAGQPLGDLTASVGFFVAWARKVGYIVTKPQRADVVCFNFDSDNWADHVGFVVRVLPGFVQIQTVEGNTSGTDAGSQDDGGAVARKLRRTSRCVFVRVPGRKQL
jgi:hypothetical protein